MHNKKIKILQINASQNFGGVSSSIYNIYKNIDKEKFTFDFLSPNESTYKIYENEILKMNGKIYGLGVKNKNKIIKNINYMLKLNKFLKNNKYDIIHINSGLLLFNFETAFISKLRKNKKIIVHSHSSIKYNGIKKIGALILKKMLDIVCDYFFACSEYAAQSMYTKKRIKNKKYKIIHNAIFVERYKYNEQIRKNIRKKLNIMEDEIIIGNVARFVDVKNHEFMIELINKIIKTNSKIKLLLIGTGPNEKKIKELVCKYNIEMNVIFLGEQKNVYDYYNAMDFFILPSHYEGLPIVGIEAQCNGIKCIFSDKITKEVDVCKKSLFLDIEKIDNWKKEILNISNINSVKERYQGVNFINKENYNIEIEIKKIEDFYYKILSSR